MTAVPDLPPLVLRCRPGWRLACGVSALALLALAVFALVDAAGGDDGAAIAAGVLLVFGAGCAHFFLHYCLARLALDDEGFELSGPLRARRRVAWEGVVSWETKRWAGGPAALRVVHGPERGRLSIPMVYEDSHLLELGLEQRRFPVW